MNSFRLRPLASALVLAGLSLPAAAIEFEAGGGEFRLSGRVQYDALLDSDAPTAQQDDGELRRARVGLSARLGQDWRAVVSTDLADKVRVRDASVEYRGWPVRIEVGRFQEPFGLAEYGGSKDTLFMERPSPASFGPDYGLGAALNLRGSFWGLTAGAFAASDHPQFGGDANEDSLSARATLTPVRGEGLLIHLGAGYTDRRTESPDGLRIGGSAETVLVTGYTPRSVRDRLEDHYTVAGAELAVRSGPVLLQAEYFDVSSDGLANGDGWYAELGWALTGERRDYSVRYGNFDGVDPRNPVTEGGIGAVEIGVRYSMTDLSADGGDRGEVAGVALNWYPVAQVRLSVNAQRVKLEELGQPDAETDVIQGRVQVYF